MFENNYRLLLRVGNQIIERCTIVDSEKVVSHSSVVSLVDLRNPVIIQLTELQDFLLTTEQNRHIVPELPRKLWLSSEPWLLTDEPHESLKKILLLSLTRTTMSKTSSKENVYVY